jgi:hypothetical protein
VSDHHHYGYADERHDHHGQYADDRHDHDGDYASLHHRHYDLEREDDTLKGLLREVDTQLSDVRRELQDALERIVALERLRPTCVICRDATADRQTVHGPACSDCAGDLSEHPGDAPGYTGLQFICRKCAAPIQQDASGRWHAPRIDAVASVPCEHEPEAGEPEPTFIGSEWAVRPPNERGEVLPENYERGQS